MPIDRTLRHATEIADALDHAHRLGVVHRDLKPANVMLTRTGLKLLDFGVARLLTDGPSILTTGTTQTLTEEGAIVGTLQYMAPEQVEGRAVDARADIFAFGAVVYEMATGEPAFKGQSPAATIAAILEREAPRVTARDPLAPPLLDRIVTQCLAKDPDERWQTARDVARQLRWIVDAATVPQCRSSARPRTAGAGGSSAAP